MITGVDHVQLAMPRGREDAAGYTCVRADGEIPCVRRLRTNDPFGNRAEFQQA